MTVAKRWTSTRQLLDDLLEGHSLTPEEVEAVPRDLDEDEHLDFKSGTTPEGPLKDLLRDYVAGFANGDGGVLVVGVDDASRQINGFEAPGHEKADDWAEKVVRPIAPAIAPPPRYHAAKDRDGKTVLFVTTSRGAQLIAVPDGRDLRYPLRIGKSLIRELPPYVVADLLLGRRSRPLFKLILQGQPEGIELPSSSGLCGLRFSFRLENASFLYAHRVQVGAVVYSIHPERPVAPAGLLLQQIDAAPPKDTYRWHLLNVVAEEIGTMPPFAAATVVLRKPGHMCNIPIPSRAVMRFAVYVIADGTPPCWYQVYWENNVNSVYKLDQRVVIEADGVPRMEPVLVGRPTVSWTAM